MNHSKISRYYDVFGVLNLILSLIAAIIPNEIEISERLMTVIAINFGYHMLYLFFSNIYKNSTRIRNYNSFNKNVGGIMLRLFAGFGILGSFFLIFVLTSNAISLNEYFYLFIICIPFGLFLGSYSLWNDLKNEQNV